ncbi:MAG TPA: hypothetical protein VLM11_03865 [Streptosporangiaceae bacterium]|nr:hypothetical protein [Streptosporangiaceae bacterium]
MIASSAERNRQSGMPVDVQGLFAEARRRRRRIRATAGIVALLLAGTLAGALASWRHHDVAAGRQAGVPSVMTSGHLAPALVGWVDYRGRLHIGSLGTGRQRVVAAASSNPVVPLVAVAGHLYWANTGGTYRQIESLDLATGRVRSLGFGMAVFAAADNRHVFIAQTGEAVIELDAAGGESRSLNLPAGWFVAGLNNDFTSPTAAADGILVQATDSTDSARATTLAIWNPVTGRLTPIVRGISADGGLLGAVTPPGAQYSLVAWWRGSCLPESCSIEITNTATLKTRTILSPLGHGFAYGVAFSPDGSRVAAFVNTRGLGGNPAPAELAIISTSTGAARLVPRVSVLVGIDVAWSRWLPGGRVLLAGGADFSGLVDTKTLSATPYYFVHGRDRFIEDSQDVNYSAVVLAQRPGVMSR